MASAATLATTLEGIRGGFGLRVNSAKAMLYRAVSGRFLRQPSQNLVGTYRGGGVPCINGAMFDRWPHRPQRSYLYPTRNGAARGWAEEAEREVVMRVYLLAPANNGGSMTSAAYVTEAPLEKRASGRREEIRASAAQSFCATNSEQFPSCQDPAKRLSEELLSKQGPSLICSRAFVL